MNLLKGKTVIVTGASRGIGKGIALTLAKNGANIAFTYSKSIEAANDLLKEISNLGVKCKSYQSNAANFEESKTLVENILNDFESFDVLINNAGITKDNLLMRMNEDDFDKVIEVNLKSVFNMVKACQSVFLKQRSGSIINISSIVGLKGNPGQSNYAASKAGIIGFSKSIALELGSRNIRSNVIAPGLKLPLQPKCWGPARLTFADVFDKSPDGIIAIKTSQIQRQLTLSSSPVSQSTTLPAATTTATNGTPEDNDNVITETETVAAADTSNTTSNNTNMDIASGIDTIVDEKGGKDVNNNDNDNCVDMVDVCDSDAEFGDDNEIRSREKSDIWHEHDGLAKLLKRNNPAAPYIHHLLRIAIMLE